MLLPVEPDPYVPRGRMLQRVMNKFLDYPGKVDLRKGGDIPFNACCREVDRASTGSLHVLAQYIDACLKRIPFHFYWKELTGNPAHRLYDFFKIGIHLYK